jgi:hypothetical protein
VANNDECPIVLRDDTALARQSNEREFKAWLTHLGYPVPELLESPYRLDWLAIRRLRFRMAKMKADGDWDRSRWDPRDSATPRDILEEVVSKVAKGRQSQPVEPMSVLGPVSADRLRGSGQKRPRCRRSPPRGDDRLPRYSDPRDNRATSPDTGRSPYAYGGSGASPRGSSGPRRFRAAEAEVVTDESSYRDAARRLVASHAPASAR